MALDRAFFDAGGKEAASIFRVECTKCGREERIGAVLPHHVQAETSGSARRLRMSCREDAPLPCSFRHNCKVELLDRIGAMNFHMAWEDDVMGPPPEPFNLADVPALAIAAFDALEDL